MQLNCAQYWFFKLSMETFLWLVNFLRHYFILGTLFGPFSPWKTIVHKVHYYIILRDACNYLELYICSLRLNQFKVCKIFDWTINWVVSDRIKSKCANIYMCLLLTMSANREHNFVWQTSGRKLDEGVSGRSVPAWLK